MGISVAISLLPTLITQGMKFYVEILRVRAEAEGRTEITIADLEALRLDSPENIVEAYRKSKGL